MTDREYIECAVRIGDFFLLGNNHPSLDSTSLRLVDHSCEVINGLSELYNNLGIQTPKPSVALKP